MRLIALCLGLCGCASQIDARGFDLDTMLYRNERLVCRLMIDGVCYVNERVDAQRQ